MTGSRRQLHVKLAGYAPASSSHGQALARIARYFEQFAGDDVRVEIDYNFLDSGRPVRELLDELEAGTLTLCYFSTSYLAERLPELGIIDLPYLFASPDQAHMILDGGFGAEMSARTRHSTGLIPLAYWDNGLRHLSNSVHAGTSPSDCLGLRLRLQPNWAHESYFRALGVLPMCTDLREGLAILRSGEANAQENPLANFVAYGVDQLHRHLTLTGHAFGARGVYASARQLGTWPQAYRLALGQAAQQAAKEQRLAALQVETVLESQLSERGTLVAKLAPDQLSKFESAAQPVIESARSRFGPYLFNLLGR